MAILSPHLMPVVNLLSYYDIHLTSLPLFLAYNDKRNPAFLDVNNAANPDPRRLLSMMNCLLGRPQMMKEDKDKSIANSPSNFSLFMYNKDKSKHVPKSREGALMKDLYYSEGGERHSKAVALFTDGNEAAEWECWFRDHKPVFQLDLSEAVNIQKFRQHFNL